MSNDFNEALAQLYKQFTLANAAQLKQAEDTAKKLNSQIDPELLENALKLVRYKKQAFAPPGGGAPPGGPMGGGMPPMDPMMMMGGGMPPPPPGGQMGGGMPPMDPMMMMGGGMPPPGGPAPNLGGAPPGGGEPVPPAQLADAATGGGEAGGGGGGDRTLTSVTLDEFKAVMTDAVEKGVSGLVQVLTRELSDLTEKLSAVVDKIANPGGRL